MNAIERDFYEDRRRRWRRNAFWRGVLASVLVLVLLGFGAYWTADRPFGPHIARLTLSGTIFDDPARSQLIREIGENENVRALILRINSPGGTSAGSEAVFEELREVAQTKPVVAVLGEVAASGGYIAAISADHIVARGNTITGSIGVIMEYPDVTELLTRLGIEFETIRSSELKAEPSPVRKISPEARARQQALIEDSYRWFRDLVGARRGIEGEELDRVANGQVFTGRTALEARLIDAIGGEPEAIDHLEALDPALEDLPVAAWRVEREEDGIGGLLDSLLSAGSDLRAWAAPQAPRLLAIYN